MKQIIFCVFLIVLFVGILSAQVPQTVSHQGVLTDTNGNAVPDGDYDLTFALSTSPNNSVQLWEETHQGVAVQRGLFNVILGSITPLDLAFDDVYYLGISVNGGDELIPRIPLTASPYSLNVADEAAVKNLNGLTGDVGEHFCCDWSGHHPDLSNEWECNRGLLEGG